MEFSQFVLTVLYLCEELQCCKVRAQIRKSHSKTIQLNAVDVDVVAGSSLIVKLHATIKYFLYQQNNTEQHQRKPWPDKSRYLHLFKKVSMFLFLRKAGKSKSKTMAFMES